MLLEIAMPFILLHHNVSYYGTEKFLMLFSFFTYVTLQSEFQDFPVGLRYKDGLEDSYEVLGIFYKTYVPERSLKPRKC